MASLEMMNFLAADLPSSSPLKRSYTLNPKRLTRNPGGGREGREVTRKPPLPKLSLVGVAGAGGHLLSPSETPSSNSSQSNIPGMFSTSTLPPSLPHTPRHFYRQNSVPSSTSSTSSRQCRPSDLPSKLISAFEGVLCSSPSQHRRGLDSSLVIEETDNTSVTSLYSSDNTQSPRAGSEDRLSGQEFLHSVTASSPVPLPKLRGERGERGDLSLDSGVVTSPSPPTDSGIALLSPATSRNRNNQEDSASVISCSLSEASDTSGSRYDNVVVMSSEAGEAGKRGVSPEDDLSDSSQETGLDNNTNQREMERDISRDSGPYENLTPEILSNVYSKSGLNSLRKILTNGQTTNV